MGRITYRAAVVTGLCGLSAVVAVAGSTSGPTVAAAALQPVFRSQQVVVQAATLAPNYSKARALPVQVVIDGVGVHLLLPGGTKASSAVVQIQARCQSRVWAVETLSAFDGPAGAGAMQASGVTPAGQLSWHPFQPTGDASAALLVWLGHAAEQQCKALKKPTTS